MPFELELAAGNSETAKGSRATDLFACKTVTAVRRFLMDRPQVLSNGTDRRTLFPKPKKLRVMDVSARPSLEYGLRKKSFPPQSD